MNIRIPAVSGRFYPSNKKELIQQIEDIYHKEKPAINVGLGQNKIVGGIVPHAGYMYSAYQAVHFFEILKHSKQQFDTIFIINPNHTGLGKPISLDPHEAWNSPLGNTEQDQDFWELLPFDFSADAHLYEHSGEVMLPLLQHFLTYNFKIVPITFFQQNYKNAQFIAHEIYKANQILKKEILIIASSDFSHQLHPKKGFELDQFVVDEILNLNAENIEKQVRKHDISVCGFGPIMSLIEYSKMISEAPKIQILKRGHSGEIIPSDRVVDYISMLVSA